MQTVIRKVYLSIMVFILCMITLVTVTFAWVGFLSTSSFDTFEVNIQSSNLKEYGIEISLDGKNFTTEIETIDIEKQILLNCGYTEEQLTTKINVDRYFKKLVLEQCTTKPNYDNNTLSDFTNFKGAVTNKLFKFDIYFSGYKVYETESISDFKIDVFLQGDVLEGTIGTYQLFNDFTYPSDFINPIGNVHANHKISKMTVDSSTACRVAFQKYEVVEKYKPELYTSDSEITDLIIYQGGQQYPNYDENGVYNFGGILDTNYNLALAEHNNYFNENLTVPAWALERASRELEIKPENSRIIDSSIPKEQVGIDQMMKVTVYFWFEGWDSDCYFAIDRKDVTLNLNFSSMREI